jgi:HAD superfamily hydrolase (TIGR01509 family)
MQLRAVIFDMDGVLIDSEPLHQEALAKVLDAHGHAITDAEYSGLVGRSQAAAWDWIAARFCLNGRLADYLAAYEAGVLELLAGTLVLEPGAVELIKRFRTAGWKIALASSSSPAWIAATLRGLGLDSAFDVVVSGSEVQRGKPDPEIFLLTADRLRIPPASILVIEDSVHGVEAARRAGMSVVAVRTRYTTGQAMPADRVVDSLHELLDPTALQELARVGGLA